MNEAGPVEEYPAGRGTSVPADGSTSDVTFLFTDIQGSTAMWERDAKRMQATLARHDEILKEIVASHGGHVFKMIGDACCAAFHSAPDALKAALAAQRAIFSEPWDERSRVRVRMALHTGPVEERGGDYFGPPVNRVARLLAAGHGGQTLLSNATRERVADGLPEGVSLRDMGERRLKDLKQPERIFQLIAPELPSEFPPLKTLETASNEDRYRLIRKIGSGGMAEVYLAYDEFLGREVAFKVLDRKHAENREAIERFRREAKNAASLRHPNIVATHDRGETESGTYYIVMEYLEGGTLEDLIAQGGPLPAREAAEIILEVADALHAAHEAGVIHRDIKPQNILLTREGEAKVADFGIARAASATTMTQAGSILGTVHYISPEQALGEPATPQSDLYSLGVVLYEMLTGELPYDAETPVGVVMKHVSGLARSPRDVDPDVPEDLDLLTARLLSRDPEARPPDAAAVAEELEGIARGLPELEGRRGARVEGAVDAGQGKRAGTGPRAGTSGRRAGTGAGSLRLRRTAVSAGRRQRAGVLLASALVLVSVGVIAFVYLSRFEPPDRATAPAAEIKKVPNTSLTEFSTSVPPGRYVPRSFRPAFAFTVDKGWSVVYDAPTNLELVPSEEKPAAGISHHSALIFDDVREIVFPEKQHEIEYGDSGLGDGSEVNDEREGPAPDDIITWLQGHPYLETSEPQPVTIGDKPGIQIDVEVKPVDDYSSDACTGAPCVVLFKSQNAYTSLPANGKARLTVLKGIEGRTVIVSSRAYPASEFDGITARAQEVIDTVKWQAAPDDSASSDPAPDEAPAQTIPTEGPLEAGAYNTDEFEPAVSFNVDEGWVAAAPEVPDALSIALSGTLGQQQPSMVGFYTAREVFDPKDTNQQTLVTAPEDAQGWVDWIRKHPALDTEEPKPVTVGGVSGMQIDAKAEQITALWQYSNQFPVVFPMETRGRVIVLTVEGQIVLLVIRASSADNFEVLLPKAQQVIDTVRWE